MKMSWFFCYPLKGDCVMKTKWIIAGAMLILFILAGVALFSHKKKPYQSFEVMRDMEGSATAEYLCNNGCLVRYGQEGARQIDRSGTIRWNVTYNTMKNPIFSFCGDRVAMADIGAKEYLILDGSGVDKRIGTPYEIQAIAVSAQGVTAVMMTGGKTDDIYMYDADGNLLVEIETVVSRDGFPITLAISEDGRKLVTSHMEIENDEPVGIVTFYNFGDVGKNFTGNLVGQIKYRNCFVPRLYFWDNDTVLVLGEDRFEIFSMRETPEIVKATEFTESIRSVAVDDCFCCVLKDRSGNETLHAYNKSGTEVMKETITFPYVDFHTCGKEITLNGYSGCEIYTIGKGKIYSDEFENGVRYFFPLGGNRYYLVEGNREKVIRLVR